MEHFPKYLDNVMASGPEAIRRELDRLQKKIVDAQNATVPTTTVGKILHR